MSDERIQQALTRLDAAVARAEAAVLRLDGTPKADRAELAQLSERHRKLKHSVAQSLRQLDDILSDMPQ